MRIVTISLSFLFFLLRSKIITAIQWEFCRNNREFLRSSNQSFLSRDEVTLTITPEKPVSQMPLDVELTVTTDRVLVNPIALIQGTFSTMGGLVKIPFEVSFDYCNQDEAALPPGFVFQLLSGGVPYNGGCPIWPGSYTFSAHFELPEIPFNGVLFLQVIVTDKDEKNGADSSSSCIEFELPISRSSRFAS